MIITLDTNVGVAQDVAVIYVGTEEEPDENGTEVVVTMNIADDGEELVLGYVSGAHRAKTEMFIPLDRLKRLIESV